MAFVLGAVLASTDPVAVSALGRRLSLPPKVQAPVQAESLFNDATSLVLFQIAVSIAVAGTATRASAAGTLLHGAGQFADLAAGGAATGGVVAGGVIAVRWRVTDPVLETVLALITPYAAYVLGAALHVSPVMAVIVAGLIIGARRSPITTAQTGTPSSPAGPPRFYRRAAGAGNIVTSRDLRIFVDPVLAACPLPSSGRMIFRLDPDRPDGLPTGG